MEKIMIATGAVVLAIGAVIFLGVISGTLLYWFWPVFAPVFHLPELTWWQAVSMTWCFHLLQRDNKAELKKD